MFTWTILFAGMYEGWNWFTSFECWMWIVKIIGYRVCRVPLSVCDVTVGCIHHRELPPNARNVLKVCGRTLQSEFGRRRLVVKGESGRLSLVVWFSIFTCSMLYNINIYRFINFGCWRNDVFSLFCFTTLSSRVFCPDWNDTGTLCQKSSPVIFYSNFTLFCNLSDSRVVNKNTISYYHYWTSCVCVSFKGCIYSTSFIFLCILLIVTWSFCVCYQLCATS